MREEWVFVLSTSAVVVKLRGFWCDMTGDCFKCPQRRNGWPCLSAAAKAMLTVWVHSRRSLEKSGNSSEMNISWHNSSCWCVHLQVWWKVRYANVRLHGSVLGFWIVYIFSLFPERTCWLWSAPQRWRISVCMIAEQREKQRTLG